MNFQIRIRTDDQFNDLGYIKDWLDEAREGFAFEHNKPDNHHFHIYLFGLDRNPDAMRRHLGKHLPSKECYSVSTSANKKGGKKIDIDPEKAYVYASSPRSNPLRVWVKLNWEDLKLPAFQAAVEEYYKDKTKNTVTIVTEKHVEVKPDKTWEKLYEGVTLDPKKYDGKTVPQIKSMIAVEYLRNGRAVPRACDLHRYAVSLSMITKYKLTTWDEKLKSFGEIPDDALVPEYNNGSY